MGDSLPAHQALEMPKLSREGERRRRRRGGENFPSLVFLLLPLPPFLQEKTREGKHNPFLGARGIMLRGKGERQVIIIPG